MNRRKVLALLAGLCSSLAILYVLDPYAPTYRLRVLEKSTSDPETTEFLKSIAREEKWASYDIPTFKRDLTLRDFRQSFPVNAHHPHYEYPLAKQHGLHELSILRTGDPGYIQIFRAPFSTDDHSRRTTINSKSEPEMSLVLLGCSFTWGSGVQDEETFASVIAREEPGLHVYNLGMRGAGPNDVLDDIEEHPNRWDDIKTKKGVVIYSMIAEHFERSSCESICHIEKQGFFRGRPVANRLTKSRYVLENGEIVRRGRFSDEPAYLLTLKRWFFSSRILASFYYVWTRDVLTEDLFPFAKMLEKIMIETKKKTGYEFYVVFYPDQEFERLEEFKTILDRLKIPHIDYANVKFDEALGGRSAFAVDGHPSRLGQEAFGRLLLKDLRKREPIKELAVSSRR